MSDAAEPTHGGERSLAGASTPGPTLVVIGGAEDRGERAAILRAFVALAGGARAAIVVVTAASEIPHEVGEDYVRVFRRLGAAHAEALHVAGRDDGTRDDAVAAVSRATGVFFTGGDQAKLVSLLGGTRVDRVLHEHAERGLVVAGTSAGAAVMSTTMIAEGPADVGVRAGCARTAPGLDFLRGVIVDQHFAERGRLGRLLSVVARSPHHLGLGVDEDTAVVVRGARVEVIGRGAATVVDCGATTLNAAAAASDGRPFGLCGVTLHVLPEGYGFDLSLRRPIAPVDVAERPSLTSARRDVLSRSSEPHS